MAYLGSNFTNDLVIVGVERGADICVLAYDTELTYQKLCAFTDDIFAGAKYIATHPDINCPAENGFVPDVGSFISMIRSSTGKEPSLVIGKPNTVMGENLKKEYFAPQDNFVMVGDRLYTDIKFGNNCGFKTILVLSGEATEDDLKTSTATPTLVLPSLNDVIPYL